MFEHVIETAEVLRDVPTGQHDRYDEAITAEEVVGTLDVTFAPGRSDEPVAIGRNAVITKPTLYVEDPDVDVVVTDRIRFRGDVYEVDGRPQVWAGAGTVIALVEQEG